MLCCIYSLSEQTIRDNHAVVHALDWINTLGSFSSAYIADHDGIEEHKAERYGWDSTDGRFE